MNDATPRRLRGSLIERADAAYDFQALLRGTAPRVVERVTVTTPEPVVVAAPVAVAEPVQPAPRPLQSGIALIDRDRLVSKHLLVPGAPVGALAEEFRQIKRQVLLTARAVRGEAGDVKSRMVLVCSANPDEGKTFSAINLAISIAAEKNVEVLLVEGDCAKPDLLHRLGIAEAPGLLDAIADDALDIEACVIRTDIPQLSVLAAGTRSHDDTELLSSDRAGALLDALVAADPRRIVIFDSPPALAASPAAVFASRVGQVMMVVRADRTAESELREAIQILDGCEHVNLVLNAVSFTAGRPRFGSYYGLYGEEIPK
ncbi:exopolysaccharide biosynthesis protein [Hephaestia sp. GCM10023244]|uniref:exopolysaccharide biosynthesis protein n=1 Tax=unclassified Hephaestia TaxID=2631281 RepID=UPI00207774DA|nr:exopolysaccharide biosynthesis protein [Hephaestia sp. MAHUQ-44]MCM8732147.1 exopolysaccharide biosynthesis protein [Hephaestia sp. MAHUQ-44]